MRNNLFLPYVIAMAVFAQPVVSADQANDPDKSPRRQKTSWGEVVFRTDGERSGGALTITQWPADGVLDLPTPVPNITRCYFVPAASKRPVVEFNRDATHIGVHVGPKPKGEVPSVIHLELAEHTLQLPFGTIILPALDATVRGNTAKLESHPGNHRIGFWSDPNDYVTWDYDATRWGMYRVLLTYSVAGADGTIVSVAVGDETVEARLESTGSWYRYQTIDLGKVYMAKAGKNTITVRCKKLVGGAVMNLKAVTLEPASEGRDVVPQNDDGTIVMHARDATVQGVKLRWEPQPQKQTLGYWANEKDFAYWKVDVKKPGRFKVEILQGCGKGQGGSEVAMFVGGKVVEFTVQDTGHWQNFIPRVVGEVELERTGEHICMVRPKKKAGVAVMDLRQVRLIPVQQQE